MSALTTTGATVFTGLEALPKGTLLWRGMLQWFGGLGIVVVAMVFLPTLKVGGMQIYQAEMPGPSKDRLTPRITSTAKFLWGVYLLLCVLEAVLLRVGGVSWFDSWCHTFATMATGGFSTRTASVGAFDQEITAVAGKVQPHLALFYLVVQRREHPDLPALAPGILVATGEPPLPVKAGQIAAILPVLGAVLPEGHDVFQKVFPVKAGICLQLVSGQAHGGLLLSWYQAPCSCGWVDSQPLIACCAGRTVLAQMTPPSPMAVSAKKLSCRTLGIETSRRRAGPTPVKEWRWPGGITRVSPCCMIISSPSTTKRSVPFITKKVSCLTS